jgi:hypothetical protein
LGRMGGGGMPEGGWPEERNAECRSPRPPRQLRAWARPATLARPLDSGAPGLQLRHGPGDGGGIMS